MGVDEGLVPTSSLANDLAIRDRFDIRVFVRESREPVSASTSSLANGGEEPSFGPRQPPGTSTCDP